MRNSSVGQSLKGYASSVATVEALMGQMIRKGWKPGGPVVPAVVRRVEEEFHIAFPDDYHTFLLAAGGGEAQAPEAYTGLWPVGILSAFNRTYKIPWNFPGLFGIGNDGFIVYALDYRPGEPVVVSLGLSSSLWDDVVLDADSFCEWLERRLP